MHEEQHRAEAEAFATFWRANPGLRFWQAVQIWSQALGLQVALGPLPAHSDGSAYYTHWCDPFYWELPTGPTSGTTVERRRQDLRDPAEFGPNV